jgi:hypothetical protein
MSPSRNRVEEERTREELRVQARRERNTEQRRINRVKELLRREAGREVASSTNNLVDTTSELESSLNRAASSLARNLANRVDEFTNKRGLDFQRLVLQKFLALPTLQHAWPEFVVQHEKLENALVVCDGVKNAWEKLKWGRGKDHFLARNVLEAAVILVDDSKTRKAARKCVGLNKKTLRRALQRRQELNGMTCGENWAIRNRKKRRDTLTQEVVDLVTAWWTEETRVSPCKKHVVKYRRKGSIIVERHAGHFLEESQVHILLKFYFPF